MDSAQFPESKGVVFPEVNSDLEILAPSFPSCQRLKVLTSKEYCLSIPKLQDSQRNSFDL